MKRSIPGLIFFFSSTFVYGQITFHKTYGGINEDRGSFIQQTLDGGFIIAGSTGSFGAGAHDVYLIKTDASGDTLWTRTFGGTNYDYGNSVQQTTDGGYIVAGFTYGSGAGSSDIYIIKTNASGNLLWSKTFGSTSYEEGYFAQQTLDGGYIIAGDSNLIKTDVNGDTIWTKNYGNICKSVQQTVDGGYIITGAIPGTSGGKAYLLKTSTGGNILWKKTYDIGDGGHCVRQTMDGGYIISGQTTSFSIGYQDLYLIKTNTIGDTLWTKTYGGTGSEYDGHYIYQATDGGYVFPAYTNSFGNANGDAYLVKTDINGNILWSKTFGGTNVDYASSAQPTSDGGYIICGSTISFGNAHDIYLIKIDANGNSGCYETNPNSILTSPQIIISSPAGPVTSGCITTNPATQTNSTSTSATILCSVGINTMQNSNGGIIFYPNPFSTQTTLRSEKIVKNASIIIFNSLGHVVKQIGDFSGESITLQRDDLSSGLYFFRLIQDNQTVATGKLVIIDN